MRSSTHIAVRRYWPVLCWMALAGHLPAQTPQLTDPAIAPVSLAGVGPAATLDLQGPEIQDEPASCGTISRSVLPLMPTNLAARREDPATVELSWSIGVTDYDYTWTLERRLDLEPDFSPLLPLTSERIGARHYTDPNDYPGVSYYRLRGEGPDGTLQYSPVVAVDNDFRPAGLRVYPNPLVRHGAVEVPGTDQAFTLALFDPLGRPVWTGTYAAGAGNPVRLDLPDLPPGVYLLQWRVGDRVRATGRVVRVH